MEAYTPEHKEDVVTSLNGLRGSISDAYTVVPQFKGKYKIPEVSFSYFNPKDEKYYTVLAEAVFVEVTDGKELVSTGGDSASFKKNVVLFLTIKKSCSYWHTKSIVIISFYFNFILLILSFNTEIVENLDL